MTSKFFLLYKRLNLASLIPEKRKKVIQQTRLQKIEVVKIFEYEKNTDGY